jgi:CRISPR-associated protein Cas2
MVMFDLPVVEKADRVAATAFRNTLLDLGFEMAQFSVYIRFCASLSQVETLNKQVEAVLPTGGTVNILKFTDKQYEQIITFRGRRKAKNKHSPNQLELF